MNNTGIKKSIRKKVNGIDYELRTYVTPEQFQCSRCKAHYEDKNVGIYKENAQGEKILCKGCFNMVTWTLDKEKEKIEVAIEAYKRKHIAKKVEEIIDGVSYEYCTHNQIQEFVCSRCNQTKKSKKIAYCTVDGEQKKLCNGCYGNISSKEQKSSQQNNVTTSIAEETIWGNIVYQCIKNKISLGKIWPLFHFKDYNGIKKGKPILDDDTYIEVIKWTGCNSRDLILSEKQCRQRMTDLLISLLETESWHYDRNESGDNYEKITINLKGDKLCLSYGAYTENDEGFLIDYIPLQTQAEPKIAYALFEGLFYINNEKVKELFFRQIGVDTREIIYNPAKKFSIGGSKEISLLDLYIMDFELFSKIHKGEFDIVFAPEVKKFFEKMKPPKQNSLYEVKRNKMQDAWERFNNSRRSRTIRELNEELSKGNVERALFNETLNKKVIWAETLNTNSQTTLNRKYECKFDNLKWEFAITGFKRNDGKWHAHFELKWKNNYDDVALFGGKYHAELYKAIQQTVIHKEKINHNPHIKQRELGERKKKIEISNIDFVVRTNLFRCYHKEHLVEEIIGLVKVVTPSGETTIEKVPCAYCPECHCFYMLQSQFNRLNESGVILCQLIEKEEYYKSGKLGDFNAASESLLMRNGYNVKANNGLTDIQRQIILKNIMDNEILMPHRISSYIDMFIAQKKNMPQYKEAVSKWQKDKNFVLTYNDECKRKIEIQKIRK